MSTRFPSRTLLWLMAVLVLAWGFRFYAVLSNPERSGMPLDGFGDSHTYHRLAYHLATGHGYSAVVNPRALGGEADEPDYEPAVTRAPTYPVFLAAAYRVLGVPSWAADWPTTWNRVRLLQAFLDGVVCVWVFLIVRQIALVDRERAALCAAALYAFNPYSHYYCQVILAESLTIFLVALGLLFAVSGPSPAWKAASGACFAAVAMCRAEYTYFGLVMSVLATSGPGLKMRVQQAGGFLLAFALVLAPWVSYLSQHNQKLTLMPVGGVGYNLFLGSFETNSNWGGYGKFPKGLLSESQEMEVSKLVFDWHNSFAQGRIESVKYDQVFKQMAMAEYLRRPSGVVACWFTRVPRLWYQQHIQMYDCPEPSGPYMLVLLTFAGLALYHYPHRKLFMLATLPAFITFICLPLHIESRYSVSTLSAVCALAGIGLGKALTRENGEPALDGEVPQLVVPTNRKRK